MKTDIQIQQDVQAELKRHPFLNASEIGVAVKNGIVTLSGNVDSYSKKRIAEKAAKSVEGVKAVAEDILIRLFPDSFKSDSDLAAAVLNALKWHSAVPDKKLHVKVEDGWITLEGTVEWGFQKEAAESAIENLNGVKGVINNIAIDSKVEARDVIKHITGAFHRSATIDAGKIIVESVGDKVILRGKVRSIAESQDAEDAAWLTNGVHHVDNRLEIEVPVAVF
jgi:osmotically-inducible protein OsmY